MRQIKMLKFFRRFGEPGSSNWFRTTDGYLRRSCTNVVRRPHSGTPILALLPVLLLPMANSEAADPGGFGRQERLQAEDWLQLKHDQKTFREGVEPLAPRAASKLDRLEQRQLGRARELELRQRQSRISERHRRRFEVQRPVAKPRELKARRELERQRLEMRIQREILRPGLR